MWEKHNVPANTSELGSFVKFHSDVIDLMLPPVLVQPTREQFEFVLVAEEQQDEETQGGDDGQHRNDDTGRRRSCKMQQKQMSRGSEFSIFSTNSTFNSTLRLTRYMWSAHRVGLGAARLDFFSALSLAAASLVWLWKNQQRIGVKRKSGTCRHFFFF